MKTTTISILLLLFTTIAFSQTEITKSDIDSGGISEITISDEGVPIQILYTIGEIAVQEHSTEDTHTSEGFINAQLILSIGLEEYDQLNGVSIFPNPTTDYINISFLESGDYNFSIFDTLGKELKTSSSTAISEQQLDLREYQSGIYYILIKSSTVEQYQIFKVIKK